jgi:hypothetical protein
MDANPATEVGDEKNKKSPWPDAAAIVKRLVVTV